LIAGRTEIMQIAALSQPAQILQIYREPLKPGCESAYDAIEQDNARLSAELGCPHPYLGAESLTGSKEVWWFNGYDSSADKEQVYGAYARNTPLLAALGENSKRKASLTFEHIEVFANYRPDLTVGTPWILGHGRFLLITVTRSSRRIAGTVFEAADGTRFIITPARTREEADAAPARAAGETNVFAVRPSWSFPAQDWIAADRVFWQPSLNGR
jgi:hypothetical protein